ncbi:MAG: hypothetical protein P8090_11450 [Gammaproteobacteria bacterium]
MRSRLDDLPRYATRTYRMPAARFNAVRLALLRLGEPVRFALPGLRTLEMVLEQQAWICVDSGLNDFPVLAWVDFEAGGRNALHEPVSCMLYTYHAHAHIIEARVLQAVSEFVDRRLHPERKPRSPVDD